MKNLRTFGEFLNEGHKPGASLEKNDVLLGDMKVKDFDGNSFQVKVVELDNEFNADHPDFGKEKYIAITGEWSETATESDVWIPKEQWNEFKRLINSVKI